MKMCDCKEKVSSIDKIVKGSVRDVESANEEGPYWARMVKESVLQSVNSYLQSHSTNEYNCVRHPQLTDIVNLMKNYAQLIEQIRNDDLSSRLLKDNAYHFLTEILEGKRLKEIKTRVELQVWTFGKS